MKGSSDPASRKPNKQNRWNCAAVRDLARLWGEQGRRAEARDLVAPAYSWLTEGFDTAGLQETKTLLDELT